MMVLEVHGIRSGDRRATVLDHEAYVRLMVANTTSGGTTTSIDMSVEEATHLGKQLLDAANRLLAKEPKKA